jgi:phosphoserine aminotransferase
MSPLQKPSRRPERPLFSAGPTVKRPGWSPEGLDTSLLGRGIRAPAVLARLNESIELTREVLEVPADYQIILLPGSDTGAMEAALWSMLGPRRVQCAPYENFGKLWASDLSEQFPDLDVEILDAPYGKLPDFAKVDPEADLVFVWNGTTSGVRTPNADFISADRKGIVICDATSAAFGMDLDWSKLDFTTFSFQKGLGGEAGIGVAVISPRGLERLRTYSPTRSIPKLLRLHKGGKADEELLAGAPVNTYSVLVIEDWLDALRWALRAGGLNELKRRTDANYAVVEEWVARTPWIDFLATDPAIRSPTSVGLAFVEPRIKALSPGALNDFAQKFYSLLEREGVGFDLYTHRAAPAGVRIWCGCTVDVDDVEALTPWLDWAYATISAEL